MTKTNLPEDLDTYNDLYLVKVVHSNETEFCRISEDKIPDFEHHYADGVDSNEESDENAVETVNSDIPDVVPQDTVIHVSDHVDYDEVSALHFERFKVVMESRYGRDMAILLGKSSPEAFRDAHQKDPSLEIREFYRFATEEDLKTEEQNNELGRVAVKQCREKIEKHKLDMKLVSAHYLLDEPKIVFFFTADSRVDFRELVKDLVSIFKTRIELRQIGVRDESRVVGGMGVCGRKYCCHGVTDRLNPVSIKMAKVQNLSLNSMKISGPCGRLLCCLSYEYDAYLEERKKLPNEGSFIKCDGKSYRILEMNILARQMRVLAPDGPPFNLAFEDLYKIKDAWHFRMPEEAVEEY